MKSKKLIIVGVLIMLLLLLGASYAYFNYYSETSNYELVVGDIYLTLNNGSNSINLTNVFPMTISEARERNDNYVTFTISGKNTTNKNVYYEILLNHGDDRESPYERFLDKDLVFDLIEIDDNENETLILDAVSFEDFNDHKIWIDTIDENTD